MQAPPFQVVSMVATFYALLIPDICYGFLPASSDVALLSVGLSIVFFFFILEGLATVVGRPRSVFSMFFYLDVVATLSLIAVRGPSPPPNPTTAALPAHSALGGCCTQDILWIQEALAGESSQELTLTRSARLARVGARAARLARMARVLRVMKLIKLVLLVKAGRKVEAEDADDQLATVPASIQNQVSDKVTRRVVAIVLASVIGSAALQYYEEDRTADTAFHIIAGASTCNATSLELQLDAVRAQVPGLFYLNISKFGEPVIDHRLEEPYVSLRDVETSRFVTDVEYCAGCEAWLDNSGDKVEKAVLNICLIGLIIVILLFASMRISRDTVQVVTEPTQRLLQMMRTSEALMSVFRAVADHSGKMDETISTVLDASRRMLGCDIVNIFFVNSEHGDLKLHQSSSDDGGADGSADVGVELYVGELAIGNTDTDTVLGHVVERAKKMASTSDGESDVSQADMFANLLWLAPQKGGDGGVVDVTALLKKRKLRRKLSTARLQHGSAADDVAQVDDAWTGRWQSDPSINKIKLPASPQNQMTASLPSLFDADKVRSQLCMAIITDVGGRKQVVGLVQALNKRVRRRGAKKAAELGFTSSDVDSLEVFCMQIADLVEQKSKEAEQEQAMNRDDAIGSMLRALSAVEPGYAASPRNRTSSQTWRMGYKKVVASNSFAKHPKPEGGVYVSNVTIDQLQRWGYGCLDHSLHELVLCTVQMFDSLGLLETVRLPEEMLFNFANAVFGAYNLVPYHNAWHGFNVLQGCYVFCSTMEQGKALPKPAQFAMLISALCHDINHDGVNTAFHVAAESEIAMLYNDLSPLENMHTRRAFELMQNDGCDVFANMTPPEKSAARSSIVQMIIGTDMKFHNDKVAKLQSRKAGQFDVSIVGDEDDQALKSKKEDAQTLMDVVLHGVDIGHPTFEWEEECRWARLVNTEMVAQVSREEALRLPVSEFMRCSGDQALGKGQVGFFQFYSLPYFVRHTRPFACTFSTRVSESDALVTVGAGEVCAGV